jgi:hypothetical protein
MQDEALGLGTQLLGSLTVAEVPGRHLTLLDKINGPEVAAIIDELLRVEDQRFVNETS